MSDQLIWTRDRPNIALHLREREAGLGKTPAYRRNCRMWRTLICDESTTYEKAWSVSSKSMIHYFGDRLYLDDFRTCYSLNGLNAMPTVIYKNPDKSHTYKLAANLHCCSEPSAVPLPNAGHRPYVLGLTKCQNLVRIDLQTGRIFQKIYLGSHHSSFKYLSWDVFQHRAVVSSTQSKSGGLKSFVLFNVFPLEVIGQFTVSQEVFGADICNANVSYGMLIVMHRRDKVKMYNLDKIIDENMKFPLRLGEVAGAGGSTSTASGAVGSYPAGIPTNIQLRDCPPVLLEVTCHNQDVCFGGHPWHYMYIPHHTDPLLGPDDDPGTETYLVVSAATNKVVESGLLEIDGEMDEVTMAFFHMDDSQRIIQLGDFEMIVNAFHTRDDGKSELRIVYRVSPPTLGKIVADEDDEEDDEEVEEDDEEVEEDDDLHDWETTLSGRRVSTQWRKRLRLRHKIRDINYDSELDFLLMSYVTTVVDSFCPSPSTGQLGIYCNQTGRLLKRLRLEGMGFEYRPTSMEMDMDLMVHIYVEDPLGNVTCNLYRHKRPVDRHYDKAFKPLGVSRRSCCN